MKAFMDRDAFGRFVGVEAVFIEPGRARMRLDPEDRHRNGLGMVHGGALFTLADMALAAAANSGDHSAVAINAGMTFVKPGRKGPLFAEARELSAGRTIAAYAVDVTDEDGMLLATFTATVYRKGKQA
ncbi:PaaI family thioesterase [Desulfovibrio sulfodismutans]|uniref:PaaI family thioesterase n=1 Tax=Desulfolutivibrio sulfodismutans TaxID=63561 RepID=A0A7K3NGQ3_9BACT|nr:PaaI family thioesterase [Desulfolutivibrio sulfodismutans]NDY55376.1 PaaI family thioesterase [Desulfolutivibrio sulfodismutans]QLA12248.1 hotdog fold thioesterase [Desulfolutivibrio sulfodismutans DSM 3696]